MNFKRQKYKKFKNKQFFCLGFFLKFWEDLGTQKRLPLFSEALFFISR